MSWLGRSGIGLRGLAAGGAAGAGPSHGSVLRSGAAWPQWPPPGTVQLGQLGVDVDVQAAGYTQVA